jgi:arylsulfatase A-like enzyme
LSHKRPNILIFMTDQQQGATVLPEHPCYTPNLDRLAAEGITFTNVLCPAPHCCPVRASFMSGLYPSRHGVFNNVNTQTAIHYNLNPGTTLFSEELQDAGYQLAYSGKWHVSRDEGAEDRGWINLSGASRKGGSAVRNRRDPDIWQSEKEDLEANRRRSRGEVLRPGWGNRLLYGSVPAKGPNGYEETGDHRIVQRALAGLADLTAGDDPWCLFIGVNGPHDAFIIPEVFARMYDPESVDLPPSFHDTLEDKPRIYQRMRHQYWGQLTEMEVRESIAHYWGYCTMEDALFGLVMEALDATGQADNTMVIYMSDHGEYCGAHGLYCKGVPAFREAYHVPTIIRWPNGIAEPGRHVDAFVSHTDFAPTFLELAGVAPRIEHSGQSLLPWLLGETPASWRDAAFTQLNGVELYYTQRIVITGRYKYVYNGFDFDEMYDIENDPHELINLAFPDLAQMRRPHSNTDPEMPWPPLPPELESVRQDLLRRLWEFAREQEDQIFNPYYTVAMAPIGPALVM